MAKKEKYRLEPLLKIKQRAKRESEINLAKVIREVEEEEKKLKRLDNHKEEIIRKRSNARHSMNEKIISGQSFIKQSHFHLGFMTKLKEDEEHLEQEITEQKEVIEEVKQKLRRARRNYMDAASDLNVMEKHRDLWAKKMQRQLNAIENKQLGELANVMHQLNKMRAG